jgi:hypothetical protein
MARKPGHSSSPAAQPQESLVERVLRDYAEAEAKQRAEAKASKPAKPSTKLRVRPVEACKTPKYVPLAIWADQLFGEFAPHKNTLLRWVHEGRIQPQPVKMGKYWFVLPNAEYTPD